MSTVRHDAFAAPLDDAALFWLGMLATDGCVRKVATHEYIRLALQPSDESTVKAFADFVGGRCRTYVSQSLCQVTSKRMVADLATFGVVPKKSLTLDCPEWLFGNRHFMRGVICGDGTVRRANRPSRDPNLSLVSGSRRFMEATITAWKRIVPSFHGSLHSRKTNKTVGVNVGGWSTAGRLIEWMFADIGSEPTLPRKQAVANELISEYRMRREAIPDRIRLYDDREATKAEVVRLLQEGREVAEIVERTGYSRSGVYLLKRNTLQR